MGDFSVDISHIPPSLLIGEEKVLFHGINKSGSGAIADVIHDAFRKARKANRIFSRYHGSCARPADLHNMIRFSERNRRLLFVDHDLYGVELLASVRRTYVTIFRHPLPRIISCHSWLRRKHELSGSTTKFPSLESFVKNSQGKAQAQICQFGIGSRTDKKAKLAAMTAREVYELALANVERDVRWFGLAERFEESIFMFAALFDLPLVTEWKQDKRNPARPLVDQISAEDRRAIEREYEYDLAFYEIMAKKFSEACTQVHFGPSLAAYQEACGGQYKDRILV